MKVRPPALLVLAVLALHFLLGREVQRLHTGWLADNRPSMPARLQVALVREMVLKAPPVLPPLPHVAVSKLPLRRPAPPVPVAVPAPEPMAEAASAPAPGAADAPEAPLAAASQPALADAEPGPEWPLSTRLSYALTGNYRGPIHGRAQVEWLRVGANYQVNLDVALGPSFAPLIRRRMSSQGVLTPEGISPRRYDEETTPIVGTARRGSVRFVGEEVQLATGVREPALRGGQDAASQFVQLTWRFLTGREPLQAGHVVRQPLVLPRRQLDWQYEVLGEETLATPVGRLVSWHLRPTRTAGAGDLSAEVWLAPALQYLPVRLLIHQDADNYIDLMLNSAPLQEAAPESDDPTRSPKP